MCGGGRWRTPCAAPTAPVSLRAVSVPGGGEGVLSIVAAGGAGEGGTLLPNTAVASAMLVRSTLAATADALEEDMVALTDAFDIPDRVLNSTIGGYDVRGAHTHTHACEHTATHAPTCVLHVCGHMATRWMFYLRTPHTHTHTHPPSSSRQIPPCCSHPPQGNAYERLWRAAAQSELNRSDPYAGYATVMRPLEDRDELEEGRKKHKAML